MTGDSENQGTLLRELEVQNQDLKTELALAQQKIEQLEALADEDVLVPVLNRRAFMRALIRLKAFDERYGVPLSLIYLDLNGFKSINDAHGHAAGDAVLRHVGTLLINQMRKTDIIGRIGGDEFAIVLANASLDFALSKAKQLAELIDETPASYEGLALALSTAYGAIQVEKNEEVEAALKRADQAMYVCKDRQRKEA